MKTTHLLAISLIAMPMTSGFAVDCVYLRNGDILRGIVQRETNLGYKFLEQETSGATSFITVPRNAAMFVKYGDPETAKIQLKPDRSARFCRSKEISSVRLLPAQEFGKEILAAVKAANKSIWILTYYISGSTASPIREFYEVLQDKARSGLDVVLVTEFGQGTAPSIKQANMNFASGLESSGVRVLYFVGRTVQHKKLLVIDERTAILGSSNLTAAGTLGSHELNVKIDDPMFVAEAAEDFAEIAAASKPAHKLFR